MARLLGGSPSSALRAGKSVGCKASQRANVCIRNHPFVSISPALAGCSREIPNRSTLAPMCVCILDFPALACVKPRQGKAEST